MVKIKDFIHSIEEEELLYPSSDGKPMADNTLQFVWIVKIKLNLDRITVNKDIFVAGDLLWYPIQGKPRINKAPDVMVAIGRPKGHRRSYKQWRENHIAPQVVFEILSKSNDSKEMDKKLDFYQKYGVQEYYIYDPDKNVFTIYHRSDKKLTLQPVAEKWTSPLLGIHFHWTDETLDLFDPDHQPFVTYLELAKKQGKLVDELRQLWAERKAEQAQFAEELAKKNETIVKKDEAIVEYKEVIVKKDEAIVEYKEVIVKKDEAIVEYKEVIVKKDEALSEKDEAIVEYKEEIQALKDLLKQSGLL